MNTFIYAVLAMLVVCFGLAWGIDRLVEGIAQRNGGYVVLGMCLIGLAFAGMIMGVLYL